jgi:small subunit ribosomal protein S4
MKIGPKFKIARRLGSPIFEKTQTAQYAQSLSRKEKNGKVPQRPKSEFGRQLIEKQKARFTYGVSEKQFAKYVKSSLNAAEPTQRLYQSLELRLDNVLYRAGLAKTRSQARQIASHGHAMVNGRRVTIPSMKLGVGDAVSVREGSAQSVLFGEVSERMKALSVLPWISVSPDTKEAKVTGVPVYSPTGETFELGSVLEFYSRS